MATLKRYTLAKFPGLSMGTRVRFRVPDGVFETDDPILQRQIEASNYMTWMTVEEIAERSAPPAPPAPRREEHPVRRAPDGDAGAGLPPHWKLRNMKIEELGDIALGLGLSPVGMKKAEIIDLIESARPKGEAQP